MTSSFSCAKCGKLEDPMLKKFALCPCRTVRYCSRECQKADWVGGHKRVCPDRKEKEAAAAKAQENEVGPGVYAEYTPELEARAKSGDIRAIDRLANAYFRGIGTPQNLEKGRQWAQIFEAVTGSFGYAERLELMLTNQGSVFEVDRMIELSKEAIRACKDAKERVQIESNLAQLLAMKRNYEEHGIEPIAGGQHPGNHDVLIARVGALSAALKGEVEAKDGRKLPRSPYRLIDALSLGGEHLEASTVTELKRRGTLPIGWIKCSASLPEKAEAYAKLILADDVVIGGDAHIWYNLIGERSIAPYATAIDLEVVLGSMALYHIAECDPALVLREFAESEHGKQALPAILGYIHNCPLLALASPQNAALNYSGDFKPRTSAAAKAELKRVASAPQSGRLHLLWMLFGPVGLLALLAGLPGAPKLLKGTRGYAQARLRLIEWADRAFAPRAADGKRNVRCARGPAVLPAESLMPLEGPRDEEILNELGFAARAALRLLPPKEKPRFRKGARVRALAPSSGGPNVRAGAEASDADDGPRGWVEGTVVQTWPTSRDLDIKDVSCRRWETAMPDWYPYAVRPDGEDGASALLFIGADTDDCIALVSTGPSEPTGAVGAEPA